jgi:hypothetical protein
MSIGIGTQVKRGGLALAIAMLALASFACAGASASFGIADTELAFEEKDGSPLTQAGAHPYLMTTRVDFNSIVTDGEGRISPDEATNDLITELPAGFAGVPTATPRCTGAQFGERVPAGGDVSVPYPNCPSSSAVGRIEVTGSFVPKFPAELAPIPAAVYNLIPPPGTLAKFGFVFAGVPVVFDITLSEESPYRVIATFHHTTQAIRIYGATLKMWGVPADDSHDVERGRCFATGAPDDRCEMDGDGQPLITVPSSCTGPLRADFEGNSWQHPETWITAFAQTDDGGEPPLPIGLSDCAALDFAPGISAAPTTRAASSPTGLDFGLTMKNDGILDPKNFAASTMERAEVTLPEGFSINPSVAEGLEVCTEEQLDKETAFSEAGSGCPNASKIGTVEVETPVLEEKVNGALYIAEPYENPFGSLTAMYIVIKNAKLGIKVVQPLKVIPDPVTGQLTTVSEDMPQLPFTSFKLHFREGTRSPLASPPGCGTYEATAKLFPRSGTEPVTTTSAFEIVSGPGGAACPGGGLPPFRPGLDAGTRNNAGGTFSPFDVRLQRTDAEQEFTNFSIKLPPGIAGILAGIPYCPEAGIAQAKARTGPHGGQEELDSPSCPAASQIGTTFAGSGVGQTLAYAPGKIYLAGPYKGSAISMVAITAGRVGPFDIGNVVVRLAFRVDRETAEVFIDATGSDPIPHIIKGIPVHLRDIRAATDRPKFVFNPTSCERTSTASTLLGSGLDFGSTHDDRPVTVSTPFQAADCAALDFKPKLSLRLKGGTKRGDHPAFRAVLKMKGGPEGGEANTARARVTLPRSAFLEQGHIKTICTRVQFRADQCPAGSVYGFARAYTPVLAEPLEGPVYLRSSEHQLPDLVASLHHEKITVDVVGRIDSLKGRIRNTFEAVPDAPVTKFVLTMQGGKKGLIVNSADLCKGTHKAIAEFTAQNNEVSNTKPVVKAKCGKSGKSGKAKRRSRKR